MQSLPKAYCTGFTLSAPPKSLYSDDFTGTVTNCRLKLSTNLMMMMMPFNCSQTHSDCSCQSATHVTAQRAAPQGDRTGSDRLQKTFRVGKKEWPGLVDI